MRARHLTITRTMPILVAGIVACGGKGGGESQDTAKAIAPSAATTTAESSSAKGMADMTGMQGMGGMVSDSMMAQMQSHMRMMDTASAGTMSGMLSMHRQMVANILAGMRSDMRSMNMTGDATWTATIDSVRQDLIHMPEMSSGELKRAMPGHSARVMRIIEMHQRMMKPR